MNDLRRGDLFEEERIKICTPLLPVEDGFSAANFYHLPCCPRRFAMTRRVSHISLLLFHVSPLSPLISRSYAHSPSVEHVSPSATVRAVSGLCLFQSSKDCCNALAKTSGACAPDTAYFLLNTKNGTPRMPI